jgi:hypothetical protein
MTQDKKHMTAQQKEQTLKLLKMSSTIFPVIFLAAAFLILPNVINGNENVLRWIQFGLVAASVSEIVACRIAIKIIEKKPVVS